MTSRKAALIARMAGIVNRTKKSVATRLGQSAMPHFVSTAQTVATVEGPEEPEWMAQNEAYWDAQAYQYDALYQSRWSQLEDEWLLRSLAWLAEKDSCTILDLGCGTGLGYALVSQVNSSVQYIGLDLSPRMVDVCLSKWPTADFRQGTMTDLAQFRPGSIDCVLLISSAFSYSENGGVTLREINRVLRPGGRLLLTALGRWSLRRVLKGRGRGWEWNSTRHSAAQTSTPAAVYSPKVLRTKLEASGFTVQWLAGYGVLSGVLEWAPLWLVDSRLAKWLPSLCHCLAVRATKNDGNYFTGEN
jgi:SAM-dependent methyltransferase